MARAVGIETRKCVSVFEADGRFNPKYDDAAESESLPGDSVIIAIGQIAEDSLFVEGGKNFIGGDMAEGPSTVIQAVASAKKAVSSIETLFGCVAAGGGKRIRASGISGISF